MSVLLWSELLALFNSTRNRHALGFFSPACPIQAVKVRAYGDILSLLLLSRTSLKKGKSRRKRLLEATGRRESRSLHGQKRPNNAEIVAKHLPRQEHTPFCAEKQSLPEYL